MFNACLMIHPECKISAERPVLLFKHILQSAGSHSSTKYFLLYKNKALEASQGLLSAILNLLAYLEQYGRSIAVMQDLTYK